MLAIDGSQGEGGGQVLRTSLALSLLRGVPFTMRNIRAGRKKAGLMRQHLVAVQAAAQIGKADVVGAEIGSCDLKFTPRTIAGGHFAFDIGSAGSTTLVLQTILYPLLLGTTEPTLIELSGGTHNPMAPSVDYLERVFMPLVCRMGARMNIALKRHGFYPAGGGAWTAFISPGSKLARLDLPERGATRWQECIAYFAQLPQSIAQREIDTFAAHAAWPSTVCSTKQVRDSAGPGNVVFATVASEHITEGFTSFGERGTRAEDVGASLAQQVKSYMSANVPVGPHLADQLLLPLALGEGGSFRTCAPTLHFETQAAMIRTFLPRTSITLQNEGSGIVLVDVATEG